MRGVMYWWQIGDLGDLTDMHLQLLAGIGSEAAIVHAVYTSLIKWLRQLLADGAPSLSHIKSIEVAVLGDQYGSYKNASNYALIIRTKKSFSGGSGHKTIGVQLIIEGDQLVFKRHTAGCKFLPAKTESLDLKLPDTSPIKWSGRTLMNTLLEIQAQCTATRRA